MLTSVRILIRFVLPGNERGQDLIEYALLGGVIALGLIVAGLAGFSGALEELFGGIGDCIDFDSDSDCA
jgi:Flp pilus assembly pilin Flp